MQDAPERSSTVFLMIGARARLRLRTLPWWASLLAFCLGTATAEPRSAPFPSDPEGVTVVDRDALTVHHQESNTTFYATLSQGGGVSYLDVYKGLPWRRIYHWPIEFEGNPVHLNPSTVLHIEDDSGSLLFHWDDFVGYREGAVKIQVTYDRAKGTFRSSWVD